MTTLDEMIQENLKEIKEYNERMKNTMKKADIVRLESLWEDEEY